MNPDETEDASAAASPTDRTLPVFRGSESELIDAMKRLAGELQIESIPQEAWSPLAKYCLLVWDWNAKMNLTRHTTPELFVKRDLLDSVELAKCLRPNEEVLDIGTGGGVPGVLVAILRPDVQVTLCDSVAKKANAVEAMVDALGLSVPVYALSVSRVLEDFRYDTLFARAVGPLARLCGWLKEDWHKFGRLLAIKGPRWPDERGEARHRGLLKGVDLRRLVSYPMPDTQSESTILQLSRQAGAKPIDEA
ncbi:MAG: 16S rRNA (guanine(527)-N(7))-methyltransferase RsmG [Pirellula sp.]